MVNTIIKIISIPREFLQKGNISFYELVKESGYSDISDQISEQDIRKALISHADYINDWLQYSEDKRCGTGWYFMYDEVKGYLVGYLEKHENKETKYDDKFLACACFIKHELDQTNR